MKMDKLLNSPWFVKIFAFFLALMLYTAVNMDTNATPSKNTSIFSSNSTETSEALSNVTLHAYYDDEKYVISNLPKDVTVYLEGPTSAITQAKVSEGYEVFVDLSGLGRGKHRVKIQHKDFSNRLSVKIEPSFLNIEIQEKVSKSVPVEIEYLNKEGIVDGYSAEEPIVLPNTVEVIGAKEDVERIGFVKGFVDVKGASETVEKTVPIKVYDQYGEVLQLEMQPSAVEVRVPIIAPNKTVPIIIERKGKLPDGLSIKSFEVIPNEATIYGPEEVIKNIDYIDQLEIDLADIKEDGQREMKLPLPRGLKSINPANIKVKIDVEPESMKQITNLPIKVIGLSDSNEVTFHSPSLGVVDITVYGAESVLQHMKRSDFHIVLNVSELNTGKHEVDLEVFGPQDLRWELNTEKAEIEIMRK